MRALIIGYGSIGKRHARVLAEEGHDVALLTSQTGAPHPTYATMNGALSAHDPDYIVIASITSMHGDHLETLQRARFDGTVLVEKPLFDTRPASLPSYGFTTLVAYNMRFHPVVQAVVEALKDQRVLTAQGYVGQHLSQWRPGRASKGTYSAYKNQGGGVVRDLSHELDLAQYLFGSITYGTGVAVKLGDVTVDSEDAAMFVLSAPKCPLISVQMNYLDHTPKREWIIVTEEKTIRADIIGGTISIGSETRKIDCTGDDSYRNMHRAITTGDLRDVCSFDAALAIVDLADKVAPL